ncbi:hypothetical protein LDENG_00033710 [Lucifuga dentata]|nr:hypothetical protein LDENG_00033710 [Lucifuga dentata]
MPASALPFILLLSTLCGFKVVSGVVGEPRSVRLTSYNMDLVLSWDPPEGNASGLLYTTEFNTTVSAYKVGCQNISTHTCDFTRNHSITVYGKYRGRVKAMSGSESSSWVESEQLTIDKSSTIGPPSVSLSSHGAAIEVLIKEPVFKISTLRDVYNYATYNLTYWKEGQQEKARSIGNLQKNWVVLSDLEPWTRYCVQVQINTERNPKPSEPSELTCESTTNEEAAPWIAAVVTFVVVAMMVAMVVIAVVYRKKMSQLFFPKDSLPEHLREFLMEPPSLSIYIATRDSQTPEEVCHPVSITDSRTVEEERSPEAEAANCSTQPDPKEEERFKKMKE